MSSRPSNKYHPSKDTLPFPFILLCLICLEDNGKSRFFSCPKQKFFHIFSKHVTTTNDFKDPESKPEKKYDKRIAKELRILKQLSMLNRCGAFAR